MTPSALVRLQPSVQLRSRGGDSLGEGAVDEARQLLEFAPQGSTMTGGQDYYLVRRSG